MFDWLRKIFNNYDEKESINGVKKNKWRRQLNPVDFYSNPGTVEFSENSEAVGGEALVLCKTCGKNYHQAMYKMCISCWKKEGKKKE